MTRVEEIANETAEMLINPRGSDYGLTAVSWIGPSQETSPLVAVNMSVAEADLYLPTQLVQLMHERLKGSTFTYRAFGGVNSTGFFSRLLAGEAHLPHTHFNFTDAGNILKIGARQISFRGQDFHDIKIPSPQVVAWPVLNSQPDSLRVFNVLKRWGLKIPALAVIVDERDQPYQPLEDGTEVLALTTTADIINHPSLIDRFPDHENQIMKARERYQKEEVV